MAQAVTHIIVPILLVSIFRDFFTKSKKKFSLHYALIAGLGGVLPDIDIIFFWIMKTFTSVNFTDIHRTYTHTIFFSLLILSGYFIFMNRNIPKLGRHKLKLNNIFLVLGIGTIFHLILDMTFSNGIAIFYPISNTTFGYSLITHLVPENLYGLFLATLDGVLLVIWISYLEIKHKISDFI